MNQAQAQKLLDIEGILAVAHVYTDPDKPIHQYTVDISKTHAMNILSATIAQKVIQSGEQLFSLTPHKRDLEALFKEVNQQQHQNKEQSDAA